MYGTDRVLDALHKVKWEIDGTLSFRRSCAHGVCGSDAMRINGRNRLACKTLLKDLDLSKPITVEPIKGLPVEKDLIVDMEPFFQSYREIMPFLINKGHEPTKERLQSAEDRERFDDTTKCILCAACTSSCPVFWTDGQYFGPAAIVNAHRFIFDSRDDAGDMRLEILNDKEGVWRCRTTFNCSEACPRGIQVTKAIAEVKQAVLAAPSSVVQQSRDSPGLPPGGADSARSRRHRRLRLRLAASRCGQRRLVAGADQRMAAPSFRRFPFPGLGRRRSHARRRNDRLPRPPAGACLATASALPRRPTRRRPLELAEQVEPDEQAKDDRERRQQRVIAYVAEEDRGEVPEHGTSGAGDQRALKHDGSRHPDARRDPEQDHGHRHVQQQHHHDSDQGVSAALPHRRRTEANRRPGPGPYWQRRRGRSSRIKATASDQQRRPSP